jgi:hypothetical protein
MTNPPLRLRGALSKLQRATAKYYSQLQHRFEGNNLVSETWAAMGHDLLVQVEGLKKLPPSFWHSLKKQERELAREAGLILSQDTRKEVGTLQLCLVRTLELEEPVILKVCAPIIRRLRTNWTDFALDFYVMLKAHIARLARLIQTYSGDPCLSQRCAALLGNLEREVQAPVEVEVIHAKAVSRRATSAKQSRKAVRRRLARITARRRPSSRPLRKMPVHAKRLIKKIGISRRRARR